MDSPFQIYGDHSLIHLKKPICITFGNFDGVHLGHQNLIAQMKNFVEKKIPLVVVTFAPHSADFFKPSEPKTLLTSTQDKVAFLLSLGVAAVIVQPFDSNFASLTADEFCDKWLKLYFNISHIFLGYDFCYGKDRQGNISHMNNCAKKYGWHVKQALIFKNTPNDIPVSSSFIRKQIFLGRMDIAQSLLGHAFFLSGTVVHGDHKGRTLGFPTANLKLDVNYVIPQFGVYSCLVELSDKIQRRAVMNCGIRPTMGRGKKLQIEAHILDFNQDIYDERIKFFPIKYIRGEMKFADLDELKKQIAKDIEIASASYDFLNNLVPSL